MREALKDSVRNLLGDIAFGLLRDRLWKVRTLPERLAGQVREMRHPPARPLRWTGGADVRPIGIVANEPVVAVLMADWDYFDLLQGLSGRPGLFLWRVSWYCANDYYCQAFRRTIRYARHVGKEHRHVVLCNDPTEVTALRKAGVEGILASHNCLQDECVFKPIAVEKQYDAVYDARAQPYKRHPLAAEVERLALILWHENPAPESEGGRWLRTIRETLAHAHNFSGWERPRFFGPEEVAAILSEARTGLCLSAEEGAMCASIQYLLCGLPVVNVPNRGGRDLFFDPETSLTVQPEPAAIARAVRELIRRQIDPETVRAQALRHVRDHRTRLFRLIDEFRAGHGVRAPIEESWNSFFANKMTQMLTTSQILGRLRQPQIQ